MNVDLRGLLNLVHQVTGFLLRLPPDQLSGIADGRIPLAVGTEGTPEQQRAASAPVPGPPADPVAVSASPAVPVTRAGRTARAAPTVAAVDHAEIAETLRKQETVNEGLAYLENIRKGGRKLPRTDLVAIATELKLEIPSSYKVDQIRSRLVDHAIGARRRFEGLRP